jgi:seryl-tRNA synthetase
MDDKFFKQLDVAIQEDIHALEDMLVLYKQKKEALIKGDKDNLVSVDEKLLEIVEHLKDLHKQRRQIFSQYGQEDKNLSQIIELAKSCSNPLSETFEGHKVKLNKVSEELSLLERSNVELLKHGLTMSDKLLNIITSALLPQTDNYDKHGKNVDTSNISISSIVENA